MATDGLGDQTRVLVTAASKHGATSEIAEHVATVLRQRGTDVTLRPAGAVSSVEGYDAVVLGSAVYAGHWLREGRDVADLIEAAHPRPAVWLFSSGPVGDPPKPDEEPVDIEDITDATAPRGHRVFAGRIDRSRLSFAERAIVLAFRAPEGDFRDWPAISAWAGEIADALVGADAGAS